MTTVKPKVTAYVAVRIMREIYKDPQGAVLLLSVTSLNDSCLRQTLDKKDARAIVTSLKKEFPKRRVSQKWRPYEGRGNMDAMRDAIVSASETAARRRGLRPNKVRDRILNRLKDLYGSPQPMN